MMVLTFSCEPALAKSLVLAAVPSDISRRLISPCKGESIQCEILWSSVAFSAPPPWALS
jgi:hypothetical protein